MIRERALKIALVLVGWSFLPPFVRQLAAYTTRSILIRETLCRWLFMPPWASSLLIVSRNPSAHCSLIAFAAWSSFAHAAIMGALGFEIPEARTGFLIASGVLVVIGVALIALAPRKQSVGQVSASGA